MAAAPWVAGRGLRCDLGVLPPSPPSLEFGGPLYRDKNWVGLGLLGVISLKVTSNVVFLGAILLEVTSGTQLLDVVLSEVTLDTVIGCHLTGG